MKIHDLPGKSFPANVSPVERNCNKPRLVIEIIHGFELFKRIQVDIAEILANQGGILLLDEAIIVFLVGPAPARASSR